MQQAEYTEICRAIRSRMSEDINNYNEEQLIKSLEDNKCIKTIKRKQCLGRSNIIVRQVSSIFQANCAFCEESTKCGTLVEYHITNRFGY